METVTIATLRKNSRETIVVRLCEMHGKPMADVRVYVANKDEVQVPTSKGVAIRPELLGSVIQALQDAEAKAIDLGLVE